MNLISDLAGSDSKIVPNKVKTKSDLDDYAISTITEMGNIMAGHYASALADLLGTKLMIDIPEFTMSEAGEIGEFLSKEFESIAEFFIIIQTSIKISDLKLKGMFFFIPDIKTLKTIFTKLDIKHEISVKPAKTETTVSKTDELEIIKRALSDDEKAVLDEIRRAGEITKILCGLGWSGAKPSSLEF